MRPAPELRLTIRAGHPVGVTLLRRIVDLLPLRLWRRANLRFGGRLHFCSDGVRTIEWNGREFARGLRPFLYEEVQQRCLEISE